MDGLEAFAFWEPIAILMGSLAGARGWVAQWETLLESVLMALRLRLKRTGRTHKAVYRLSAMDGRSPRDGRVVEELGVYDPANKDATRQLLVNDERIKYWLGQGASPTDTVRHLLRKRGIL